MRRYLLFFIPFLLLVFVNACGGNDSMPPAEARTENAGANTDVDSPADAGGANEIPEPLSPPRMVNDFAGMLSTDENSLLEQKLRAVNDSNSIEFAIIAIKTTGNYDIEDYALKIGRQWGIGKKDKNNGILILVALGDRKIDIEVGYGLEDRVTDGLAKRVIENDIKPAFKQKNYYEGLDKATNSLIDMVASRYQADAKDSSKGPGIGVIILIIIGIIVLISIFGGRGGGGLRSGGMGPVFWGGGGGGSWGGGGGGSSFGGFGGGSFGGGGASGSW